MHNELRKKLNQEMLKLQSGVADLLEQQIFYIFQI